MCIVVFGRIFTILFVLHIFQNEKFCLYFVPVRSSEAPRYKPEDRGFDSRWCHWNFSLTQSFRSHYGPG